MGAAGGGGAQIDWFSELFEPLARLTLLDVLLAAMKEVSHDLAPGCVAVRLDGPNIEFVVIQPSVLDGYRQVGAADADEVDLLVRSQATEGRIRLRFEHLRELEAATALFDSGTVDRAAFVLSIPSDGSVPVLCTVLKTLDDANLEPETLTVHLPTLDDVFLSAVGDRGSETHIS
jgi:hypothetical protein